jgi:hypothetical protein
MKCGKIAAGATARAMIKAVVAGESLEGVKILDSSIIAPDEIAVVADMTVGDGVVRVGAIRSGRDHHTKVLPDSCRTVRDWALHDVKASTVEADDEDAVLAVADPWRYARSSEG